MKLVDIIKTKEEIIKNNHKIENNVIKKVEVDVVAHFGNCPTFEIICSNVYALSGYSHFDNLGFVIHAFYELFNISREDGLRLSDIKNLPCRIIVQGSRCIGFGHSIEDKFVYSDDFSHINKK